MGYAGKPTSSYRRYAPDPPRWDARARQIARPPLWEFVFLSMLLHAIAISLFGAPSGGSSEGRAMWGALQVVLQGPSYDAGPTLKIDRGLGMERPAATKSPAPHVTREPRV